MCEGVPQKEECVCIIHEHIMQIPVVVVVTDVDVTGFRRSALSVWVRSAPTRGVWS